MLFCASLYPSIAVILGLYPKHLGPEFFKIYKEKIVDVRLAEKAKPENERDNNLITAFKEAANIPYGKSKEYTSLLYDPSYTFATTINGQLLLSMLLEQLYNIPDILPLQINTDGITVKIKRKYVDEYYKICKEWMKETKFELEYAEYSKMIIANVNNYLAVKSNGKIKEKGAAFVINPELHKNSSNKISKIALQKYFLEGIPVEKTIKEHKNILDFCIGNKKRSDADYDFYEYDKDGNKKLIDSKVIRYVISNSGSSLIKIYRSGKLESLQKGYYAKLINNIKDLEIKDCNINYQYYIRECNKVIKEIEDGVQPNLF